VKFSLPGVLRKRSQVSGAGCLHGGVLGTSEASGRAKRPKFQSVEAIKCFDTFAGIAALLLLPIHCRVGSEGARKQCVMRIITMTETLAELIQLVK
jgi:hypothetical protein